MTPRVLVASLALSTVSCASINSSQSTPRPPEVDYHQHLVSPAFARIANVPELDGAELVRRLDQAGVARAVVLSTGYSSADERKKLADPDRLTREENDWTAGQVVAAKGRLIGFCGVNPLRDEALTEIRRCLRLAGMRGLKLHFGNSGVSLRNPDHLARMHDVFTTANALGAPILVHMRARGGENFGPLDAQLMIERLLPAAQNVDVIIAHFGGGGPGYPEQADEVMTVFGTAAEQRDPRLRRTYFDVATIVTPDTDAASAALIAKRIRQVGPGHVLYGSDLLTPTAPSISEGWALIATRLGLSAAELGRIAASRLAFTR